MPQIGIGRAEHGRVGRRRARRRSRRSRAAPRRGTPNRSSRSVVPAAACDVHQRGARGVGRVARRAARRSAGRPASFRPCRCARSSPASRSCGQFCQRPGDLAGAEIGIEQQPGLRLQRPARGPASFSSAQSSAVRRSCQTIAGAERPAGAAAPEDDRLALVGDADRGDPLRAAGLRDHRARAGQRRSPDLLGIMLDPAGPRIMLDQAPAARRRGTSRPRANSIARVLVVPSSMTRMASPWHPSSLRRGRVQTVW